MNNIYIKNKAFQSILALLLFGFSFSLNAQMAVVVEVNPPACHDYSGTATATVSGGVSPYDYNWSNGADGATAYSLSAGNYSLTITDTNGTTLFAEALVVAPDELIGEISSDVEICEAVNGTLTANQTGGTSPFTYLWSNGQTSQQIDNLTAGNYTVTVSDANGCDDVAYMGVPAPLTVELEAIGVICAGLCDGAINADIIGGTAPFDVLWSNGATSTINGPLPAGEFCITVTDANGCVAINCEEVTEPSELVASVTLNGDCENLEELTATVAAIGSVPPYSYEWSNGSNEETISNLEEGESYSVTVTDSNGCEDVETVTVGEINQLSITVSGEDEICVGENNGSVSVVPGGGVAPYSIVWSTGDTTEEVENLGAGTYEVTVTDVNGCTGIQSVSVDEGSVISVSFDVTDADCGVSNGSITADPSGGMFPYFYIWGGGISTPTIPNVSNLAAGSYTITVSDAQGCFTVATVEVADDAQFEISAVGTNATCPDATDGSALVSISGTAAEPVSYSWSNGDSDNMAQDVVAGTYTVTVTDANGCSATTDVEVGADEEIESPAIYITNASCEGDIYSIIINAEIVEDITSYELIINGETYEGPSASIDIVAGETVDVQLNTTYGANCTNTSESSLTTQPISLAVAGELEGCVGDALFVSATSTLLEPTYTWTPAEIFTGDTNVPNPEINSSIAGTYEAEVTVTSLTGCSLIETVTIVVAEPSPAPNPDMINSAQECDVLQVNFTDDNPNAGNYNWVIGYPDMTNIVAGGSDVSVDFTEAGNYQIAIMPTVPCSEMTVIEVNVAPIEIVDFTFEANCDNGYVVNFTDLSSNSSEITGWNWTIEGENYTEQNPSVSFENAGTINANLSVTYADGCQIEMEQPVELTPFDPTLPTNIVEECGGGNDVELFPNADPNYNYEWTNVNDPSSSNPTVNITETTVYDVTITDAATGCMEVSSVTVVVPTASESPMLEDIVLCETGNMDTDATIQGNASYIWSDEEDFGNVLSEEAIYNVPVTETPTTYYVQVTDENGCISESSLVAGAYPVSFTFGPMIDVCTGLPAELDIPDNIEINWALDNPLDDPINESNFFIGTITNEFGCSAQDTLFVNTIDAAEALTISAEPDTILAGESTQLMVTEDDRYSYDWDNEGSLDSDDIFNPIGTPDVTTLYEVVVVDERGCPGVVQALVTVIPPGCEEEDIYFPNAFTPDDDDLNDVLYLQGLFLDEVFFAIYNRWGEKVFESNDISEGWDGTFNGERVCPDVYGYYLRVKCTTGEEFFRKGNVSVLR